MSNKVRSPFFYVGDKYKLMPQIIEFFPKNIQSYYEPFVGGGSSSLYVSAKKYLLNDNDKNIIELHEFLKAYSDRKDELLKKLINITDEFSLSCSFVGREVPEELKKEHNKTYYSRFNKESYNKLRIEYNKDHDLAKLYILLIYGFNHMIRFNNNNIFNLPVGNVDFNKNVYNALSCYIEFISKNDVVFSSKDYIEFVNEIEFNEHDFVYLDPPYLISKSEYNKNWTEDDENNLYDLIDYLNSKKIYFGLSNLLEHKGQTNDILKKQMNKYYVHEIKSNYISRFDNSVKKSSKEVYVTNYEKNRT